MSSTLSLKIVILFCWLCTQYLEMKTSWRRYKQFVIFEAFLNSLFNNVSQSIKPHLQRGIDLLMRETVNLIHTIIWREGLLWWLLLKFMKINTISFEVMKFGIYREGSNYWFTHRQRSELFGNRSSEISKIESSNPLTD